MVVRRRRNPQGGGPVVTAVVAGLGLLLLGGKKGQAQGQPASQPQGGVVPTNLPTYKPGSPEQIALFQQAAQVASLPAEWASHPALIEILKHESGGKVGIPNYLWKPWVEAQGLPWDRSSWPRVWEVIRAGNAKPSYTGIRSHAAGLGQLQPSGMAKFQPSGLRGIGDALEEAVGMLRYIKDRYGSMDAAWDFWQKHNWY